MKNIQSKLIPGCDFSFSVLRQITAKIEAVKGINLGQGTCQLPVPELVLEAARKAITKGHNRYAPAHGVEALREAMSDKLNSYNHIPCRRENIIVTNGSTGAYEVLCHGLLDEGDEVILFSPTYPYHRKATARRKAVMKVYPLQAPHWNIDFEELEKLFSAKTKYILLCTPNNPTGKVYTREELDGIAELCKRYDTLCVTDEVYEYMTYDAREHLSMASFPGMFERTLTMGSYSKTFSITGWRIGYLVVPDALMPELATLSDQLYVCGPTPFQWAVAEGIRNLDSQYYADLKMKYTSKREKMIQILRNVDLDPLYPEGAYYVLVDTGKKFPGISSDEVVDRMIRDYKIAGIPASEFMGEHTRGDPDKSNFLRFCFSVPDEVLDRAGESLKV